MINQRKITTLTKKLEIRSKNSMLRSDLCDFFVVKGDITVK